MRAMVQNGINCELLVAETFLYFGLATICFLFAILVLLGLYLLGSYSSLSFKLVVTQKPLLVVSESFCRGCTCSATPTASFLGVRKPLSTSPPPRLVHFFVSAEPPCLLKKGQAQSPTFEWDAFATYVARKKGDIVMWEEERSCVESRHFCAKGFTACCKLATSFVEVFGSLSHGPCCYPRGKGSSPRCLDV